MQLQIPTTKREELINITPQVKKAVEELLIKEQRIVCNKKSRTALIYSTHTTCAITINENADPTVKQDILQFLNKLVPQQGWTHTEGNSDAHIKTSIIGNSELIPLENKELQLGTWQGIFLAEFDGPRERKIIVEVI